MRGAVDFDSFNASKCISAGGSKSIIVFTFDLHFDASELEPHPALRAILLVN